MKRKNVSIFYLSIGSGHQIAAEAISKAIQSINLSINIRVIDPFTTISERLPNILDKLQALSILLTPGIYDHLWRHRAGALFEGLSEVEFLQNLLINEIREHHPDIIVSTHVLPCSIATAIKKREQIDHVYGVVTDFGINPLWPLSNADHYFVGHNEIKNTLIFRGIDSRKISVSGIPIRPNFTKKKINTQESNKLNVLLVLGGLKRGAYVNIERDSIDLVHVLSSLNPEKISSTIMTGNQEELYNNLNPVVKNSPNINILGFTKDVNNVLTSHDILIAKPGGLITAEALANGLGIIVLKAGPGQETANSEFLARHGVALRGESISEVDASLKKCIEHPELVKVMKGKAKRLGKPIAAKFIAGKILRQLEITKK